MMMFISQNVTNGGRLCGALWRIRRNFLSTSSSVSSDKKLSSFPFVTSFWASRLNALGIKRPTDTQIAVLSALAASKKHCLIQGETGSGKTLAYLLPIVEALKSRIDALESEKQLYPVALIVVPSQELVAQVVATAQKLLPTEWNNMVRGCHGNVGLPKNMNCGIVVATPRAVLDTVHVAHRSKNLLYVVLDEADALLSGALRSETIQGVLTPFKMVMPEERPLHIFCAATFPNRGKDSVAAFLDKYYPEGECQRITTVQSHKHLRTVHQSFLQLDAALPLTSFEVQQQARLVDKVKKIATELRINKGDGESESESNLEAEVNTSTEDTDSILIASKARTNEDKHLAAQADEERYLLKVDSIRRDAVLESLFAPANLFGFKVKEGDVIERGEKARIDGEGGSSHRRFRSRSSSLLTSLVDEPPKTDAKKSSGRGSERLIKESATALITAETITNLVIANKSWPDDQILTNGDIKDDAETSLSSSLLEHSNISTTGALDHDDQVPPAPTPRILPFQPLSQSRPKFSEAECDLIPTTLIFMNSSAGAYSLKRFLADRLPTVRVSDIHSDVPDAARRARLSDFVSGRIRILVSTNLAARGLDTVNVVHVIQAEFSSDVVGHIHRVGRTARAGRAGIVTNLIVRRDMDLVRALVDAKDGGLSHLFSKDRSFKRQIKRSSLTSAQDEVVMAVLEDEEQKLKSKLV